MLISDYLIICNLFFWFDLTYFLVVGKKYRNTFVCYLVQMKTSKSYQFSFSRSLAIIYLKQQILLQAEMGVHIFFKAPLIRVSSLKQLQLFSAPYFTFLAGIHGRPVQGASPCFGKLLAVGKWSSHTKLVRCVFILHHMGL